MKKLIVLFMAIASFTAFAGVKAVRKPADSAVPAPLFDANDSVTNVDGPVISIATMDLATCKAAVASASQKLHDNGIIIMSLNDCHHPSPQAAGFESRIFYH
jgi:hypothetical protein